MPAIDPVTLVASVASDLVTNAGFPIAPKRTELHVEPESFMPHECPQLAVWMGPTEYTLMDTGGGYQRQHHLFVAWTVYNALEAETGGTGNAAAATELEAAMEPLTRRLASYALSVPGALTPDVVATIVSESREPTSGSELQGKVELVVETLLGW